ncbi:hypothetical protein N0V88_006904 [Collariella sp. IMI 366227]|nr:hypothetical protein N0V88_006904 [Collariella sp. IMI 366227]
MPPLRPNLPPFELLDMELEQISSGPLFKGISLRIIDNDFLSPFLAPKFHEDGDEEADEEADEVGVGVGNQVGGAVLHEIRGQVRGGEGFDGGDLPFVFDTEDFDNNGLDTPAWSDEESDEESDDTGQDTLTVIQDARFTPPRTSTGNIKIRILQRDEPLVPQQHKDHDIALVRYYHPDEALGKFEDTTTWAGPVVAIAIRHNPDGWYCFVDDFTLRDKALAVGYLQGHYEPSRPEYHASLSSFSEPEWKPCMVAHRLGLSWFVSSTDCREGSFRAQNVRARWLKYVFDRDGDERAWVSLVQDQGRATVPRLRTIPISRKVDLMHADTSPVRQEHVDMFNEYLDMAMTRRQALPSRAELFAFCLSYCARNSCECGPPAIDQKPLVSLSGLNSATFPAQLDTATIDDEIFWRKLKRQYMPPRNRSPLSHSRSNSDIIQTLRIAAKVVESHVQAFLKGQFLVRGAIHGYSGANSAVSFGLGGEGVGIQTSVGFLRVRDGLDRDCFELVPREVHRQDMVARLVKSQESLMGFGRAEWLAEEGGQHLPM